MKSVFILLVSLLLLAGGKQSSPKRIITLSSALTETIAALGLEKEIVATDVTSADEGYLSSKPKVSRSRDVSVEGLLKFRPDLILAPEGDLSKTALLQLKKAGTRVVTVQQEFSSKGAEKLIRTLGKEVGQEQKAAVLITSLNKELSVMENKIKSLGMPAKKVMFIYARGAGTMSVAGRGSNMDAIIKLSGNRNAVQEFADFKPYSTEALIKANPDVLVLFDFGASSLGGINAILKMPGVAVTSAGRKKKIVMVDGPLMVNFSTRLPEAIWDLYNKIQE